MPDNKTLDVEALRQPAIKLHGLTRADEAYVLYYDETNNIRRLLLAVDGWNAPELKCFVLGVIGHRGPVRPIDLSPLRAAARIQPNAPELKFEYFAKGEFPAVLSSQRISAFLAWIEEQGFLVHFLSLDPFYWSTVDIIDSILADVRRLATFNVLAHNRDDHAKNFTYLMERGGAWRLSPAYDLTFSAGPGGEQTTTVMGSGKAPSTVDLTALGKAAGLAKGDIQAVLDQTREAVQTWSTLAAHQGVNRQQVKLIGQRINAVS